MTNLIMCIKSTRMICFFAVLILTLGVTSCGPISKGDSLPSSDQESYPIQTPLPSIQVEAYPVPTVQNGILLAFTTPISQDDSEVHGVGPAGLPITIQNITLMGEYVGAGIIDEDGTFSIPVTLQSNIRIGLSADIESFGLNSEDIQLGSGAMTVPLVGFFYDTARIEE